MATRDTPNLPLNAPYLVADSDVSIAEITRVAQVGLWVREAGQPLKFSAQLLRMLGLDPHQDPGGSRGILTRVHPEDRADIERVLLEGSEALTEFRVARPDGVTRWMRNAQLVSRDDNGEVLRQVGVLCDITSDREGLQRFNLSQRTAHVGSYEHDLATGVRVWSPEQLRIYGLDQDDVLTEEVIGARIHPDDRAMFRAWTNRLLREGEQPPISYRVVHPDGSLRYVEDHAALFTSDDGAATRVIGATIDFTERLHAIEQQQQRTRAEAIRTLAIGVTRDLGRSLQQVLERLDSLDMLFETRLPFDTEAVEITAEAHREATHCAMLMRQLEAFSQSQPFSPQILDLRVLLRSITPLLRRIIGSEIELEIEAPDELWPIYADPTHMEAALLNLVTNARDAMPEGGVVHIRLDQQRFHSLGPMPVAGMSAGRYVQLSVGDQGGGIPEMLQSRVFEPYFTTAESDQRKGLGLALTQGSITQNGGFITLESTEGEGARFDIFLPACTSDGVKSLKGLASDVDRPRVLVVEDDDRLRGILTKIITSRGCIVRGTPNPLDAIEYARQHSVDLVFTDLMMPEINGINLARELRAHAPSLPVVFMTGWLKPEHEALFPTSLSQDILYKPFSLRDLCEVLDRHLAMLREG